EIGVGGVDDERADRLACLIVDQGGADAARSPWSARSQDAPRPATPRTRRLAAGALPADADPADASPAGGRPEPVAAGYRADWVTGPAWAAPAHTPAAVLYGQTGRGVRAR